MDRSLSPAEWKVGASAGKHTQVELPLIGEAPSPALLDADVVARASFNGCLADAARLAELERYERMAA